MNEPDHNMKGAAVLARGAVLATVLAAALFAVFALARSVGPGVRAAGMVVTAADPAGSTVAFDDASAQASAFLAERDSVEVVAPWTMPARDLLRIYHLENNRSARTALLEQLGIVKLDAVVPEGTALSLALTPAGLTP